MASIIETIKAKVDVTDEIGSVVALQKSGKSLKGLCPFHNERSPSFYVNRETQTWHCFGCNESGDIFTFVQKQQGFDFHQALLYLAEKAGVSAEDYGVHLEVDRETSAARERLRKLNEEALLWFHQLLLHAKDAKHAREYIQSRGISSDSVMAFGLGYASDQWEGLTNYLLTKGYTEQELVQGGLARSRENNLDDSNGGVYDYFRNRLIFPIRDMRGYVIGFGGRALGDGKPKYLNSPQTLLFEKNTVLYGINMARDAIKQIGQVVIVEGYVDAVIAHQYGTKQTVACIGSAITEKHIQQLKKLTKQVTLALDPDAAGNAATEHGIQEALRTFDRTLVPVPLAGNSRESFGNKQQGPQGRAKQAQPRGIIRLEEQVDAKINVVQLPEGEDPDEFIRRDFAGWFYAVSHPLPLIEYYFTVKTMDLNLREPTGKAEAAKRLFPVIGMISDRIKRDEYVRKLARMISIDERSLHEELQHALRGKQTTSVNADFSGKGASAQTAEQRNTREKRNSSGVVNELVEPYGEAQAQKNEPGLLNNGLDRRKGDQLKWEDYLIGLLLQNPGLNPHICGIIDDGDFAGTDTRELYHILNSRYQRDPTPSHQPFETFVPSALLPTVARALKCVESSSPLDGGLLVKDATQCAHRIKRARLLQLNIDLQFHIQDAAEAGDTITVQQLGRKLLVIYQQLHTIHSATRLQG